jgi:hypothetical protein
MSLRYDLLLETRNEKPPQYPDVWNAVRKSNGDMEQSACGLGKYKGVPYHFRFNIFSDFFTEFPLDTEGVFSFWLQVFSFKLLSI